MNALVLCRWAVGVGSASLKGSYSGDGTLVADRIRVAHDTSVAEVALQTALTVPAIFIVEDEGEKRLKTLSEIDRDIQERYREFLHAHSRINLQISAGQRFFDVSSDGWVGARYWIDLDLTSIFEGAQGFSVAGKVCVSAAAAYRLTTPGLTVDGVLTPDVALAASWRLGIQFAAGMALPRLDLGFPELGWKLPSVDFPGLTLPNLDWELPRLDLDVPAWLRDLKTAIPIGVTASNPRIAFTDDAFKLEIDEASLHFVSDPTKKLLVATGIVVDQSRADVDTLEFMTFALGDYAVDKPLGLPMRLSLKDISFKPLYQSEIKLQVDIKEAFLGEDGGTFVQFESLQFVVTNAGITGFKGELVDGAVRVALKIDIEPLKDALGNAIGRMKQWLIAFGSAVSDAVRTLLSKLAAFISRIALPTPKLPSVSPVRGVFDGLGELLKDLASELCIQIVFDESTRRPVRMLVSTRPKSLGGSSGMVWGSAAFRIQATLPTGAHLAVLAELAGPDRGDWFLLAVPSTGAATDWLDVKLSSDLWLGAESSGPELSQDLGKDGQPPPEPLVSVRLKSRTAFAFAIAGVQSGRARFAQTFRTSDGKDLITLDPGGGMPRIQLVGGGGAYALHDVEASDFDITANIASDAKDRALPFLRKPSQSGDDLVKQLTHWVKLTEVKKEDDGWQIGLMLTFGQESPVEARGSLKVKFKLSDWWFSIDGSTAIQLAATAASSGFKLFGLTGNFVDASGEPVPARFLLDVGGEPSLTLFSGVFIRLACGGIKSADGGAPTIEFLGSNLRASRSGISVTATYQSEKPVQLPGVNTYFKFRQATLRIVDSQVEDFQLAGSGSLPAWMGDAKVEASLQFGLNQGKVSLKSAYARLEQVGKTIDVKPLRLKLTVTELGFSFHMKEKQNPADDDEAHFYFLISGSAEFKPNGNEFEGSLLAYLEDAKLELNQCPLTDDISVLGAKLNFTVPLPKIVTINVFNLFRFEIRSVGFAPEAFGARDHGLKIGGQVSFSDLGDIIDPDIEFHAMYLGAPKSDNPLPRVRFDGLRLSLRIASKISISGALLAVDGKLPMQLVPAGVDTGVTAKGFVGEGSIEIPGLPPLSAAFGFMELEKDGVRALSWFVYLQANKLTYQITAPIPLYIREIGFGLGYRYTLAGIAAADEVTGPTQMIKVMDEIAKRQGDLARYTSWSPEVHTLSESGKFTFAMRALLTMASASPPGKHQWKEKDEKKLPSMFTMDVVAALRSDFTFLMTLRLWLAVNYAEFYASGPSLRERPLVTGFMYLSGPKQEFMARLASSSNPHFGENPVIPPLVQRALTALQYSATLYMRPGLLHFELGWPDQLRWSDRFGPLSVSCVGGFVFRVEDGQLLLGMNFGARGRLELSASAGGDSFGASVSAVTDVAFTQRMIAVIDARRPTGSMYYGLVAININVEFSVSAWLRIRKWGVTIGFSISFSFGLHVGVALELVLTGEPDIAGRARCYVSIRAFGRTLGIHVNLAHNGGKVDQARARVARYLDIGLSGPSQLPADPFEKAALRARGVAPALRAVRPRFSDDLRTLHAASYHAWGRSIDARGIDASLDRMVLVSLVPMSVVGDQPSAGFFCTPPEIEDERVGSIPVFKNRAKDYVLKNLPTNSWVFSEGKWMRASGIETPIMVDWNAKLPGSTTLPLGSLMDNAFVVASIDQTNQPDYADPSQRMIEEGARMDGLDAETVGRRIRESYHAITEDAVDRAANDARDLILAQILDGLAEYSEAPGRDVPLAVRIGLTFLVPHGTTCEELLGLKVFHVHSGQECDVLEAPDSFALFEAHPVDIAGLEVMADEDRIEFAWDLIWRFPDRRGNKDQPEHHLFAYEVLRKAQDSDQLPLPRLVHPCGTLGMEDGHWKSRRAVRQFTDDLSTSGDALLSTKARHDESIAPLEYVITPIATDGSRGDPCNVTVRRERRPALVPPPGGTLCLTLDARDAAEPVLTGAELRFGDLNDHLIEHSMKQFRLVLRPLAIGTGGSYGNSEDVERRPALGVDDRRLRAGDQCIGTWLLPAPTSESGDIVFSIEPGKTLEKVLKAGRGTTAWVAFVQALDGERSSALLEVDLLWQSAQRAASGEVVKLMVPELEWPYASKGARGRFAEAMTGRAGRARLREFKVDAQRKSEAPSSIEALSTIRLSWDAGDADDIGQFPPVAAFDLLELRSDELPPRLLDDQCNPVVDGDSQYRRALARLKLVTLQRMQLTPPSIGEPASWTAHYPLSDEHDEHDLVWPTHQSVRVLPRVEPALLQHLTTVGATGGEPKMPAFVAVRVLKEGRVVPVRSPESVEVSTNGDFSIIKTEDVKTLALLHRRLSSLRTVDERGVAGPYVVELIAMRETDAVPDAALQFSQDASWLHPYLVQLAESLAEPLVDRVEYQSLGGAEQGTPENTMTSFAELRMATPAGKDPYGWEVLHRLGLATTIRVFDRRYERYLHADELQARLDSALTAMGIHKDLCVEVLMQPHRHLESAAFEDRCESIVSLELAPAEAATETSEILRTEGLAMVQLSLRPRVNDAIASLTDANNEPLGKTLDPSFALLMNQRDISGDFSNTNVIADVLAWSHRFKTHTVPKTEGNFVARVIAARNTGESFAVAANPAGRIDWMLTSKDVYGRVRGYAAEVIGRYDEMLFDLFKAKRRVGTPPWCEVATPRLKPVEKPSVLRSANTFLPVPLTDKMIDVPVWEIVVGRHAEQSLSETNAIVATRLAFSGIAHGLLRRVRERAWLDKVRRESQLAENFVMPTIVATRVKVETEVEQAWLDQPFDPPQDNSPALWQGAEIHRYPALPYFYEHEMKITARAGLRVSEVNTVRQPVVDIHWQSAAGGEQIAPTAVDAEGCFGLSFDTTRYEQIVDPFTDGLAQEPVDDRQTLVRHGPDPDVQYQIDLLPRASHQAGDAKEPLVHVVRNPKLDEPQAFRCLPLSRRFIASVKPRWRPKDIGKAARIIALDVLFARTFEGAAAQPPRALPPRVSYADGKLSLYGAWSETLLGLVRDAYVGDAADVDAYLVAERALGGAFDLWEHRFEGALVAADPPAGVARVHDYVATFDPALRSADYAAWRLAWARADAWRSRAMRAALPTAVPTTRVDIAFTGLELTAKVELPDKLTLTAKAPDPAHTPRWAVLGVLDQDTLDAIEASFGGEVARQVMSDFERRHYGGESPTFNLRRWRGQPQGGSQ